MVSTRTVPSQGSIFTAVTRPPPNPSPLDKALDRAGRPKDRLQKAVQDLADAQAFQRQAKTQAARNTKIAAAEKLKAAREKIRVLQLQARLAAANGDAKAAARAAKEAASLAREVGLAVRDSEAAKNQTLDAPAEGQVDEQAGVPADAAAPSTQPVQPTQPAAPSTVTVGGKVDIVVSNTTLGRGAEQRGLADEVRLLRTQAKSLADLAEFVKRQRRGNTADDAGVESDLKAARDTLDQLDQETQSPSLDATALPAVAAEISPQGALIDTTT